MKNKLCFFSCFLIILLLVGCGNTSNSESSNSSIEPSSDVVVSEEFKEYVEVNMVEGKDYIDHANTYNGEDFEFNDSMWYINKLDKVPLPDPHVYCEDGTYYIVGTNDAGNCKYVDCYYTTDFVDFNFASKIFDPSTYDGWENDSNPTIYAPEIFKIDGYYYMYYSACDNTVPTNAKKSVRRNSVVRSKNVLGPYEPIVENGINGIEAPLFMGETQRVLDATIFIDDDGKMYMYYATRDSEQYISGVEMKSPYEADWSTKKEIVRPGTLKIGETDKLLYWEAYPKLNIAEAPYMIKSPNGKYYMTYSVNGCWNKYYNICYAVSDSPLGEFVKPYEEGKIWTNLLMGYPGTNDSESLVYNQWSGFASGTGHHCFFNIGEQIMIGYHAHENRNYNVSGAGFVGRYFAMDPLFFDEKGVPYANGPTYSLQPIPEEMSGYKNIALDASIRVQNVENEHAINDNYIVDCYNLESDEKEVKLGSGYSFIELTFDREYEIGGIAIYNSSLYEKTVFEIEYIDMMNGNAFEKSSFSNAYVNDEYEFTFPNSAFTFEIIKEVKTNKIIICFNLGDQLNINEIVILGK
ncbi:MAG: family 43 glycosylhydrolase [Bacilli bacterium]|nr:family 43 glycosylhydrolase [Bacilli bacterium]